MSERCVDCGEATLWEQELGSAICTVCGTLSNPSQNILASHLENPDTSGYDTTLYWSHFHNDIMRSRNGWTPAGFEKEARERKNTISMHTFISSLLLKLANPGLILRAQTLFDEVKKRSRFRWGRKAKLVAGASTAVALREARKHDSIRDIAYLLEETPLAVSRSFTSIVRILQLQLSLADPSQHLPTLQTHVHTMLSENPGSSSLPSKLIRALSPLVPKFPSILHTSTMLSTLVTQLETLANLPTPPTACAILILAIEGELSTSLPNMAAMAQCLGSRMGVSTKVIMQRYKIIYDAIEGWIREVPWLEAHERRGGTKGRSKIAKRVVVARGLKDVVQFQDEIWQKRLAGLGKPALTLDVDDDVETIDTEDGDSAPEVGGALELSAQHDSREEVATLHSSQTSRQYRSAHHRSVSQASQFLLRPLSSPTPTSDSTLQSSTLLDEDDLFYLFACDVSALAHVFVCPPTRLQRLVVSRRGGEEAIADEELFEDGEMEGYLRTDDEIVAMEVLFNSSHSLFNPVVHKDDSISSSKKRKQPSDSEDDESFGFSAKKTRRIDLDALARLLDPSNNLCDKDDEGATLEQFVSVDPSPSGSLYASETDSVYREGDNDGSTDGDAEFGYSGVGEDDGEVIEEWRPLSPGGVTFDEDRYEL